MYFNGSLERFFGTFTAVIGERESGKTTVLKKILAQAVERGYTVMLYDSATDHMVKSLLVHAGRDYSNFSFIASPPKNQIIFDLHGDTSKFPYTRVRDTNFHLYLFDVSKYLEEGYDYDDLAKRNSTREYYKRLVLQELTVMFPIVSKKKTIVLMDEIEFIPDIRPILEKYKQAGISLVSSLHTEESLSTSNDLFEVIKL